MTDQPATCASRYSTDIDGVLHAIPCTREPGHPGIHVGYVGTGSFGEVQWPTVWPATCGRECREGHTYTGRCEQAIPSMEAPSCSPGGRETEPNNGAHDHGTCDDCDVTDPCPCCGLRWVDGRWVNADGTPYTGSVQVRGGQDPRDAEVARLRALLARVREFGELYAGSCHVVRAETARDLLALLDREVGARLVAQPDTDGPAG